MAAQPNPGSPGPYKGNLKAERVVWMSRTSDVIGSHLKKDMDSYLTLIRRKIQEKCSTTQELINQIRKTKVGDGNFVTPNEFRFTLIKFGLIFPQSLVDKIFAVFDSDRSGTMDFDEFAMWIMNSEFRPVMGQSAAKEYISPEEELRRRLDAAIKANPSTFRFMKRDVSYLDLISAVNSGSMGAFTERDARHIFQVLDPKKTGFIPSKKIVRWGTTGSVLEVPVIDETTVPPLNKCMQILCGKNPKNYTLLNHCFAKLPKGSALKLGFDEFRGYLLAEGLGRNRKEVEQLFVSLGGTYVSRLDGDGVTVAGSADVEKLLAAVPKFEEKVPESLEKRAASAEIVTSRADRHLRENVRKSYKTLKAELEALDPHETGYLPAEKLLQVINKICMPMSYEDFRKVLVQLSVDDNKKVNFQQFLHIYNPRKAPHILDGNKTIPEFDFSTTMSSTMASSTNDLAAMNTLKSPALSRTTSAPSMVRESVEFQDENYEKSMKRAWQSVLRECQRSDPERTGAVARNTFVNALENSAQAMSTDTIIQLANKYTVPNSNGLIDYITCFRNYLNDMAANMSVKTMESTFKAATMTQSRDLKGQHPWEFSYSRDKRDAPPYWKQACTKPRTDYVDHIKNPQKYGRGKTVTATDILSNGFSEEAKKNLLKNYEPRLINICAKCPSLLGPIMKDLKTEFKRARHDPKKDEVLTAKFFAVMQSFNIDLSNGEMGAIARAFRAKGMPESVKYEEFINFCKLVSTGQ
jgi:Ca2+-binding EF-hand superfamily protein